MVKPQNYIQSLISRVASLGVEKNAKTLIVSCAPTLKHMIQHVAFLKLHDVVEFLEASEPDLSGNNVLAVEPDCHAVLIAADSPQKMIRLGRLCSEYQRSGIPVVVIAGWSPPLTARQFNVETSNPGNISTAGMFDLAARYCSGGNSGDILEFGTFQGHTLQCAYHAFVKYNRAQGRRFIAFDSFKGIVGKKDGEGFADGTYATSEKSFRFSNVLAGVPNDKGITVSGPYSDTLLDNADNTRRLLEPLDAAVVHIDCDVEAPAKLALDFVTPYLKQGTLLLFDEYDLHGADNSKGERGALRAWLKENPDFEVEPYRLYHVHARSFIVHKN